jgi:hypothetical protein
MGPSQVLSLNREVVSSGSVEKIRIFGSESWCWESFPGNPYPFSPELSPEVDFGSSIHLAPLPLASQWFWSMGGTGRI